MSFGKKNKRIAELEALVAKQDEVLINLQGLNERLNESIKTVAVLYMIEKENGANVFCFVRNGETFQIKTFATMSDNVQEWKHKAGLVGNAKNPNH